MIRKPRVLIGLFVCCAVLWVTGFPWLTDAEEGTAANVEWLVSTIVALIGVVALIAGVRGLMQHGNRST